MDASDVDIVAFYCTCSVVAALTSCLCASVLPPADADAAHLRQGVGMTNTPSLLFSSQSQRAAYVSLLHCVVCNHP
jgi:hypothetical protein